MIQIGTVPRGVQLAEHGWAKTVRVSANVRRTKELL